jgi:hypothetical protein
VAGLHERQFEKGTPARPEYPEHFPYGTMGVRDMFEHTRADDRFDRFISQRKPHQIGLKVHVPPDEQVQVHRPDVKAPGRRAYIQLQAVRRADLFLPQKRLRPGAARA